ncbi:Crp/Fnr family transcriptional regulator [Tenuibacillus multivorans]|uniref:CRP/FNR family transcriptional regulator, anaerobic regulatory protein n=1 Tax=Tenuibacillus multivorans TaxID=237069 RepID=A0A1H0C0H0_9BACI|nr:Crp/Fnr family transcriptional regulator [Tenuibacillus multivorans]GEL77717.1 hypothetical protein TMU01_19520 [Tenuibacillus multivorans]SDN51404.1 CRP/FNR family transcriptional regulator, anaerobic regulatory protein [Tenuibacillus multivorans]
MEYSKLWYLSKIGFLESIPTPVSLEALEKIKHTYYKRNDLIRSPETHQNELCFIKTGSVRLYAIDTDGKQFTYSLLGAGSTFGKMEGFSLSCDDVFVEAIEDTHFCTINENDFLELASRHPILLQNCLKVLSERLEERENLMKQLATGTVRERIIYLLQSLYNRYHQPNENVDFHAINLPISQQELANMIGSSREAVSTTLNELAKEGLVRFPKRKKIEVHNTLIADNPLPAYIQEMYY